MSSGFCRHVRYHVSTRHHVRHHVSTSLGRRQGRARLRPTRTTCCAPVNNKTVSQQASHNKTVTCLQASHHVSTRHHVRHHVSNSHYIRHHPSSCPSSCQHHVHDARDHDQPGKADAKLPGKGNPHARPVHQTTSMMKWTRTSRLSMRNSLFE